MPNSTYSAIQTLATATSQQPTPETVCPTCGAQSAYASPAQFHSRGSALLDPLLIVEEDPKQLRRTLEEVVL
jgi:hypothetical protein